MFNIEKLLKGTKVLDEVESPINGRITVFKSLGLGTYLQVGGLTQSGGILVGIWQTTIKKIHERKSDVDSCLILGLGGGTVAKLVMKYWPDAVITGVDFDPVIVDLGKKYLGLGDVQVRLFVKDAFEYCQEAVNEGKKFDLILIDLYKGSEFPAQFEGEQFPTLILKLLRNEGLAVFNRLYSAEKRPQAVKFGKGLEKIFKKVEAFYPEANVMFITGE
jgi:spermidine synthase